MSHRRWILGGGLLAIATALAIVFVVGGDGGAVDSTTATPMFAFAPNGEAWEGKAERSGTVAAGGLTVGRLVIAPPAPTGFEGTFSVEPLGGVQVLRSSGAIGESEAKFEWWVPTGNPHTAFAGEWETTLGALQAQTPVSSIVLPPGELTYVNPAYETTPFAGAQVVIPRIAAGPIVWRSGAETLTLWQWSADRVTITEADEGGIQIDFAWWHPEHHALPADCGAAIDPLPVTMRAALALSFDGIVSATKGRLADGATGAAVPVFFDPHDIADPRYREGAAASASDFLGRARTIALGHSDRGDARHGNGGLAGTGVGGTIVVPTRYAAEKTLVDELKGSLLNTTVELASQADLWPATCEDWAKALGAEHALLGPSTPFEGAFPNLLAPDALQAAPASGAVPSVWPSVELSGRRKDVVQQTLSRTYLDRLEKKRGVAVLRVPLIATRNPLVAGAAESLLEPERQGNWTIEEEVARALAEIELLVEERHFALTSLRDLSDYLADIADVQVVVGADAVLTVTNPGEAAIRGFTLIVDGTVVPVVGEGAEASHEIRDVPGGRQQTWVWFDLPPGETQVRLERPDATVPSPITWTLPK